MPNPSHIPARVAADAREADATLASLAAVAEPTPAPAEPTPAPAPVAAPAPTPAPVEPVPTDEMRLRLQRLEQQLSTANGRLEAQTEQAAALQRQLLAAQQAPQPAPAPAPAPAPLISEKDREEYGEDLIGLIGRVIDDRIGNRLSDAISKANGLEGRLARLENGVQTVQHATTEQRAKAYEAELTRLLPTWMEINEEPALLDWLENRDTLSGKKYGDLLQDANNRMDANRVVAIFQTYKTGLPTSALPAAGPQSTTTDTPAPMIDPLTLAAPDTTAAAPAPSAPPAGRVWTMADVDKLFDDKQKKRITEAQFLAMEADYNRALAEGRVVAA